MRQKLSEKEHRVLQATLLRAEVPLSQIARELKLTEPTVRRTLSRLYDRNIFIRRSIYLNPSALGLDQHFLVFSLAEASLQARNNFVKKLCASDHVGTVSELGGEFQYELNFYSKDSRDLMNFIDSVGKRIDAKVQLQGLALVHSGEYSSTQYTKNIKCPPLTYSTDCEVHRPDDLDHKLLYAIANFGFQSLRDLSRTVGAKETTVNYRIKRLEQAGVITGHIHLVDSKQMGGLPFALLLYSDVMTKGDRDAVKQFCRTHPRVSFVDFTVGAWSARILSVVDDYQQALTLMYELQCKFPRLINKILVLPQLRFHKTSLYPFESIPG